MGFFSNLFHKKETEPAPAEDCLCSSGGRNAHPERD